MDVDGDDLVVWKAAYGVNANGDADGDQDSDGQDFLLWQRNVGNMTTGISAVPEPSAVLLAAVAGLACLGGSRRRRAAL
jgi:hypothetical protein